MQEWTHSIPPFGCKGVTRLEEGVLDTRATDVFLYGNCHSLALALRSLLGDDYPLIAMMDDLGLYHVLIEVSDGTYLDIRGLTSEEELHKMQEEDDYLEEVSERFVQSSVACGDLMPLRVSDAVPFARALCEKHHLMIREERTVMAR